MPLEDAIQEQIEKIDLEEKPVAPVEETPEREEVMAEIEEAIEGETLEEAKNLYKLLKDPETRRLVLKTLGEREGLFDKPIETKKEEAAVRRGIREILSDKLGKEYEFMIPKLGDALEAILDQVQETQQQSIGQLQQEQINSQVVHELSDLARETKGISRGFESKMSALATKFTAGAGVSVKDYVRGLYAMASGGKSSTSSVGKIAERINRNSKDVPSRLTSSTGSLKDGAKDLGKLTIDQSVKYALQQLGMNKE